MNVNNCNDQLVAEFNMHESAEKAVRTLGADKFDVKNITIIGLDYHTEEHPTGYVNTGDRIVTWGKYGAFWGSMWGILFGSAIIFIPGIGNLIFAGWLASTLVGAAEGAIVGAGIGALGAALSSMGIPKDSILKYEAAIKAGKFLVIVRGTTEEVGHAKTLLEPLGANSLEIGKNRELAAV